LGVNLARSIRSRLRPVALRVAGLPPVPTFGGLAARHTEWSLVSSADDLQPQPTDALMGLLLAGSEAARHIQLEQLASRCTPEQARYIRQWPGEHYRLLAGLVKVMQPRKIVEIGTATGMSALALLAFAPPETELVTYDLIEWSSYPESVLRPEDFGKQITQRLMDVSRPDVFESQKDVLAEAQIMFIDGPKDGLFEPRFTDLLVSELRGRSTILVYDDIRLVNMLQFWRELPLAKLDATSLGHWSGTGLASVA
jgi:predicted O-methyltransferase YrrM